MDTKIFYLTKDKLAELKKEYEELVIFERKKSEGEAPKAFESEDLNPDFVIFQDDLNFLRSRIEELKNVFEHCEIIKKPAKGKSHIIDMGAKVKIDINGAKEEFTVVGTLEANPSLGKISNESPVGKALLGHKIGDEVIVASPIKTVYKIKSIRYDIS